MNECWTKSAEDGREKAHFGLAVSCARRFQGRGVPMEELIGEAEAALLWAASRYDVQRGARFSTYAIPFALGALRELCRRNAPMTVPREDLRALCAADRLRETMRDEEGREPTIEELGLRAGIKPERLATMLFARERMRNLTSDQQALAEAVQPGESFESRVLWRDALRRLGRPYGAVLWLRYFAGCTQTEIARRFSVSQAQISRWEAAALRRLQQEQGEDEAARDER